MTANITELEVLLERATPGPWEYDFGTEDDCYSWAQIYWTDEEREPVVIADYNRFSEFKPEWGQANPALIVAMRNALPGLLTAHKAMVERIEALEAGLLPFARIADMEKDAAFGASVFVNVERCRDARALLNPPVEEL